MIMGHSDNINGCLWCGELERTHCQRYDDMHPPGARGYTAPSNALRKARLLLNISIRQATRRRDK